MKYNFLEGPLTGQAFKPVDNAQHAKAMLVASSLIRTAAKKFVSPEHLALGAALKEVSDALLVGYENVQIELNREKHEGFRP